MTKEEATRRMAEGDLKGWVYLIEDASHAATKVGWAKDPERRLAALQTGHPGGLTLIAVIPGTKRLEHDIHRKLIYARLYGEWFQSSEVKKLLRPVIRDFGLKLEERAQTSRSIPEVRRYGARPKVEFFVKL